MELSEIRQRLVTDDATGCAEWLGSRTPLGYGMARFDGRVQYVHRIIWAAECGPIPKGIEICHRCDNPPCGNLDHLFAGTHAENMADSKAKGRNGNGYISGETHPWAKLTEANVRTIRADSRPARVIAAEYGVSTDLIRLIRRGKIWKHMQVDTQAMEGSRQAL